ncbi:hypothetical protein SAMD00019534_046850 [Acytostelium subglobosum LB1]|uniref:hypothetical protein n=1 Tax=Acytostelium subglobosum LB1 TaxID=1410327 RepID=UPI0006449653|nr:hypothetical protein SAMD00019534_046850 [Acytostelium subglobosum LB1]GAM21510.1 hypothetical protein SAMD00019534_046850 [Acytostelium subglobosum LB1]|eukprot:XP_012755629.1 hypothetical protein SAMD00019534_046850 [Acytostelium subglobosum LB1]
MLTGFPMTLISNSNTMVHTQNTLRTYSSTPVGLLLTNTELFIYNTSDDEPIELLFRCPYREISTLATGYLHSSSTKGLPPAVDGVLIDNSATQGQYSMKLTPTQGRAWTLMSFSPGDTPDIQRERVLKIVAIINTVKEETLHKSTTSLKSSSSSKNLAASGHDNITISNMYYKLNGLIIQGEMYLSLQRMSFIQKYIRDPKMNVIKKCTDNYSFSIETKSIFECKRVETKIVKHHATVRLSTEGERANIYIFCIKKPGVVQYLEQMMKIIAEAQVVETHSSNSVDHEHDLMEQSSPETSDVAFGEEDQDGIIFSIDTVNTKLDDKPTHKPLKNNFKVNSDLLTNDEMMWVQSLIPLRHTDDTLELVYSTKKHGISIRTFFSRLTNRSPCIMIIRDDLGHVFGAFTSDPWNMEKTTHYGSGETFIFKVRPESKKYAWTRINDDFMLSTKESFISMGSGGKGVGLWIDEELLYGSTNHCETFNNEILAHSTDFKIVDIEVWSPAVKKTTQGNKMMNATELFGTRFTAKPTGKAMSPYA